MQESPYVVLVLGVILPHACTDTQVHTHARPHTQLTHVPVHPAPQVHTLPCTRTFSLHLLQASLEHVPSEKTRFAVSAN